MVLSVSDHCLAKLRRLTRESLEIGNRPLTGFSVLWIAGSTSFHCSDRTMTPHVFLEFFLSKDSHNSISVQRSFSPLLSNFLGRLAGHTTGVYSLPSFTVSNYSTKQHPATALCVTPNTVLSPWVWHSPDNREKCNWFAESYSCFLFLAI